MPGKSAVGTIIPETTTSGQNMLNTVKDILAHPERYISSESENMKKNGERVEMLWPIKSSMTAREM